MELLSIVLLSEGNTDLLARTLESLRGLSDSSVEIIVTGQLEQTGVLELLVSEETLRGKLRYLALPAGEKPGVCLNAAARLAKGRYLTFLREGAALSPMVCGAAAETLDRAKGAVWCYSGAQVGGTEEMLPPINWPDYKKEGKLFSDLISERSVAFSSVV
ncbi:MAG TPA: glycosyltransferase, partial [Candidatus Dorea gallistercoris]|nr:glycosyltransferase [Candidatus Dorea gallistercoris]